MKIESSPLPKQNMTIFQ